MLGKEEAAEGEEAQRISGIQTLNSWSKRDLLVLLLFIGGKAFTLCLDLEFWHSLTAGWSLWTRCFFPPQPRVQKVYYLLDHNSLPTRPPATIDRRVEYSSRSWWISDGMRRAQSRSNLSIHQSIFLSFRIVGICCQMGGRACHHWEDCTSTSWVKFEGWPVGFSETLGPLLFRTAKAAQNASLWKPCRL